MRILILTTSYPAAPGDYRGRFVHELAAWLAGAHDVRVVAPHPGHDAPAREELDRVHVHRVAGLLPPPMRAASLFGRYGLAETLRVEPWRALSLPGNLGTFAWRTWRESIDADLVVSNWLLPGALLGGQVAARRGIPHVAIEHGGGMRLLARLPGRTPLATVLAERMAVGHFVSGGLQAAFLDCLPLDRRAEFAARSLVFPMPAPLPDGAAIERLYFPPLKFLFVGRFIPIKGAMVLLQALARVKHGHLTLAGAGPGLPEATRFVRENGLADRVTFRGEVPYDELPKIYSQHDVLVIPSLADNEGPTSQEGSPRVLLEGMAAGLVPLVSASGGLGELVRHEHNGLLFPAGDVKRLAERLRGLSNRPRTCRSLAEAARATARTYSFDRLMTCWRDRGVTV